MARMQLGEMLVAAGIIDELQLEFALEEHRRSDSRLGSILVEVGLVDEATLVDVLSSQLNFPSINLDCTPIDSKALSMLDYDLCTQYQCLPFRYEEAGKFLDVAMADPVSIELFDIIRVRTRCNIRPHVAGPQSIERAIQKNYLKRKEGHKENDRQPSENPSDPMANIDDKGLDDPLAKPRENTLTGPMLSPSSNHNDRFPLKTNEQFIEKILAEMQEIKSTLLRNEITLRKLMALVVDKGLCTHKELATWLR